MNIKKINKIVKIVLAISFLTFIFIQYYYGKNENLYYNFNGVLKKKEIIHATPKLYIDTNIFSMYLYSIEKFEKEICIGDSLVKKQGEHKVTIYRKDDSGTFQYIGVWN